MQPSRHGESEVGQMKKIVREFIAFAKSDPESVLAMMRWTVLGILLVAIIVALLLARAIVGAM